jgi:excisionase family DNA binding protein
MADTWRSNRTAPALSCIRPGPRIAFRGSGTLKTIYSGGISAVRGVPILSHLPGDIFLSGAATMADRWLSVDEIAAHLGISRDTVYKWIKRRDLPAHKTGRLWKFRIDEVDAWVRTGRSRQSPEPRGSG